MNWNEYGNGRGLLLGIVMSGVIKKIENEKSH
jgi:hypothetical protein